jgi:hypothetical protein
MSLIQISHTYGIVQLESELRELLSKVLSPQTIVPIIQQCFELKLLDELRLLEPSIATFLEEIPIQALSESLDVITFARVIEKSNLPNGTKIKLITGFMGDWSPSREEKRSLVESLTRSEPGLKALLEAGQYNWVLPEFVRSLR